MGNFLTCGPHKVLKFDRKAGPGADAWNFLEIHFIRENNMTSGQKHASSLIDIDNRIFLFLYFVFFQNV